jgi:hypothetical protein
LKYDSTIDPAYTRWNFASSTWKINKKMLSYKKAIPGASWDGSRFLSHSATATCCELSIGNLLSLVKQKQAFGREDNFLPDVGTITMFLLPLPGVNDAAKIISQR